jgi:hypothetical protein
VERCEAGVAVGGADRVAQVDEERVERGRVAVAGLAVRRVVGELGLVRVVGGGEGVRVGQREAPEETHDERHVGHRLAAFQERIEPRLDRLGDRLCVGVGRLGRAARRVFVIEDHLRGHLVSFVQPDRF